MAEHGRSYDRRWQRRRLRCSLHAGGHGFESRPLHSLPHQSQANPDGHGVQQGRQGSDQEVLGEVPILEASESGERLGRDDEAESAILTPQPDRRQLPRHSIATELTFIRRFLSIQLAYVKQQVEIPSAPFTIHAPRRKTR